jgi:GTP-binding protein
MIDASGGKDIWQDYQTVRNELKVYSGDLAKKKEIIVINKIDLIDEKSLQEKIAVFKLKRKKVFAISALGNLGIDTLISAIKQKLLQSQ